MIYRNLLFFVTMLLSVQLAYTQSVDQEINDLINSGDFIRLNQRYSTAKDSMQITTLKLLADAFVYTSQNKPAEACEALGDLANNHQENLGLNGITVVLELMGENMRYMGRYAEASEILRGYLDQTAAFNGLDSATRERLESYCPVGVFGNSFKPQITRPKGDCEIPIITADTLFKELTYINVKLNGTETPFVFDTGCDAFGTNSVSEGFAKKHGIRIFEDSVRLMGTDYVFVKLGVADSMQIGDIIYRNVAFTIAPGDHILPTDSVYMDAVLGSVFMKAMGEFQIFPNLQKIVFPAKQSELPLTGSNMMLRGGQPYIEGFSDGERLLLHLDTGGGLGLSNNYYQKNKEKIESAGTLKTGGGVGGFGGLVYIDKYILPKFPLTVAGKTRDITDMTVLTKDMTVSTASDGTVGTDFTRLFDKVTVNFDKMFITVE